MTTEANSPRLNEDGYKYDALRDKSDTMQKNMDGVFSNARGMGKKGPGPVKYSI